MPDLRKFWKAAGPLLASLVAVANAAGPQSTALYILGGIAGTLLTVFGPANKPPDPVNKEE